MPIYIARRAFHRQPLLQPAASVSHQAAAVSGSTKAV
jgi:hypothetical protein